MNARMNELDKQAKLWAIDNTNFPISSHIPAGYTEKFAELIVRECANIAFDAYAATDGAESGELTILKHFGVEE